MIAKNICKTHTFKNRAGHSDWEGFTALCECGADEHAHDMIMEYDSEFNMVSLSLYFKTWTANPYKNDGGFVGLIKDFWRSIKFRFGCLFNGYNTMHYNFIFAGEEAIQDYINALQDSLNNMKATKAANEEKENEVSLALNNGD